ncbi:hypothetical protein CRG98_017954 [Punica granatum]|uniref:Uncharacterized protein n=1 Tax=Punica granatum TaxID=22663 RepID=A0A2I0JZG0_PUNGR|nr:hypothetical protein CRG98_017954 [Punica granatum]
MGLPHLIDREREGANPTVRAPPSTAALMGCFRRCQKPPTSHEKEWGADPAVRAPPSAATPPGEVAQGSRHLRRPLIRRGEAVTGRGASITKTAPSLSFFENYNRERGQSPADVAVDGGAPNQGCQT